MSEEEGNPLRVIVVCGLVSLLCRGIVLLSYRPVFYVICDYHSY